MAITVTDKSGAAMIARCPICCWPLAATREDGCVPGDCSYRPREGSDEWHRIQRNRKALTERQSHRLDPEGGIPGRN